MVMTGTVLQLPDSGDPSEGAGQLPYVARRSLIHGIHDRGC
jgi:hypothetical protein